MPSLNDSRVLLTGGAGLVGSFVAERLLKENVQEVIILDNFFRGRGSNLETIETDPRLRIVKGDIRDRPLVNKLLKGIDYCFHLAALRITHCAFDPNEAFGVMYDGTFHLLEACAQHNVKKFILASSASVYGQAEQFPTPETHHPYNNRTLYGAAKLANELMCRSFQHMYGLNFNALRYFNIYGPRMDTFGKYTEVLIRWYHLIRQNQAPVIFGDGKQTMDFIYIEDTARATVLALTAEVNNTVFNIASGQETTLDQLCHLLLKVMGSSLSPQYMPIADERKKVEVYRRLADVSLAREKLEFKAQVGLEEGLIKLVQWLDKETACVRN